MKQVIAVLAAVIAGFVALAAVTFLSSMIYPAPEGLDVNDAEAMRAYVESVPIGGKLIVLASWVIGAFVAGFVAQKMAPDGKGMVSAMIAGAVLLLAGIMNALNIPHPLWMTIIGLLQYIPVASIGAEVAE